MKEEIRPQARGRGQWDRRIGRHRPGGLQLIAPEPVVPHVRRVADDGGVGTAREITWRRGQKITLEAVGLDQLLAAAHGVDTARVNVDSIHLLTRFRSVRFRQDPHRRLKKGTTPIARVKDRSAPVGQGPSHQHGRQIIGRVVDAEEPSRTDAGPILKLARRWIGLGHDPPSVSFSYWGAAGSSWRLTPPKTTCPSAPGEPCPTRSPAESPRGLSRNSIPFSRACHSSSSMTLKRITLLCEMDHTATKRSTAILPA